MVNSEIEWMDGEGLANESYVMREEMELYLGQ
jgi:hypothetical protein